MPLTRPNDPAVIRELLMDPGTWIVVGLSDNRARTAYGVSRWVKHELGKAIIPVHPRADTVHGSPGYASVSEVPDQDIKVVECFVNSGLVGAVVDEVIANKDRLTIDAVWLQKGVVDEAAAARARAAGLLVVMDTCPMIEWPRINAEGNQR